MPEAPRLRKPAAPPVTAAPAVTPAAQAPAPLTKTKIPHPLAAFVGTRVVITTLAGTIMEGDLTEMRDGLLVLEQCRVVGTQHEARVDRLVVAQRKNLSHINSVPTDIKRRETP